MKTVACIGNFDGVHLGHQALIEKAKEIANGKFPVAAITFDPHPSTVFSKKEKKVLSDLQQREEILYSLGVDEVIVIPFNKDTALIPPNKFIEFFLNRFELEALVCGFDYSYGHKGSGKAKDLVESEIKNFKVAVVDEVKYEDQKISSTLLTRLIEENNIELAEKLMNHKYNAKISVKSKQVYSDNVLPLVDKYTVVIDGKEYEVNKGRINYKDCENKPIMFI